MGISREEIEDSPLYTYLTIVKGYEQDDATTIVNLVHNGNFLQIIYNYGDQGTMKDIMKYMIDSEEYEICIKMEKAVKAYAKSTGRKIELHEES